MQTEFFKKANRFLTNYADILDISESNFEKARDRYNNIGEWLKRPESKLLKYNPEIYPQGSFRLGTVVKPITDEDQYDLDLVCQVEMSKSEISQYDFKHLVGDELIAYAKTNRMNSVPENGKRCWTMEYADDIKFHMDILPAIPEDEAIKILLQQEEVPKQWANYAISITDNSQPEYWMISHNWEPSNPKGFALWFEDQMKIVATARRQLLVDAKKYARIEDVPAFEWKTPLQRSIQILKRHRDIMFAEDTSYVSTKYKDHKPISIILTTLASHAYNNELDQLDALINIVNNIPKYIENQDDEYRIENPVDPAENFAEKWNNEPIKAEAFDKWLEKAKGDIQEAVLREDINYLVESMKLNFGERLIKSAATLTLGVASAISINRDEKPRNVNIDNPTKSWGSSYY